MDEIVFPCLGATTFFVVVFAFIVAMRYIRYKETLALAEKGLVRPERNGGGNDALKWGIAITALGLALSVGLYPLGFWIDQAEQLPLHFGPWMLAGLLPMFFGLGLILIHILTKKDDKKVIEEKVMEIKQDESAS